MDDDRGMPNLWRCKRCGIFRAERRTDRSKWIVEFSDADGGVLDGYMRCHEMRDASVAGGHPTRSSLGVVYGRDERGTGDG